MLPKTHSAAFAIALVFAIHVPGIAQNGTGTIFGRIAAANGMAAGAVRVAAVPVGSSLAADGTIVPVSITETDSLGRYQLNDVSPGRYRIVAGPSQAPTFYPGTADTTGAAIVVVEAGAALDAVNFQLQRFGGVRVSGRVIRNEGLVGAQTLTLFNLTTSEIVGQTEVLANGTFEFVHVQRGTHGISARGQFDRIVWSSKPLEIEDRDVTGIDLTGSASVAASGRIMVEGGGPLHSFWLSFKGPAGWTYVAVGIESARDGTMRVALPVGEYRVTAGGVPIGYQLESLKYGQSNLLRESLKVAGVVQPLSVVFKVSSAAPFVRVGGRLLGIANLPQLYGTPPVIRIAQVNSVVLETTVGFDGTFEFAKVLPGIYQIFAPGQPWAPLIVGSEGVRNLEFSVPVYRRISGRVVVEDGALLPPSFDVTLASILPNGQRFEGYLSHDPDGTFSGIVPEGDHRFLLAGFRGGYKVVSIVHAARDVLQNPLRVAGGDATEILVTLRFIPRPTFRVSGRVLALGSEQQGTTPTVLLSAPPIRIEAPIGADGSFSFPAVEKGIYSATSGSTSFEKVTVTDRDIDGIEFRPVSRSNTVEIEVVAEDGSPKPKLSLMVTRLQGGRAVEPDDVLESAGWLPEGEYRVEVRQLPDADYLLKSLTYGAVNLLNETLKIAGPNNRVRVVATVAVRPGARWANVSGRVVGLEKLKALNSSQVFLRGTAMELEVPIDPGGRFEFSGVLPGTYSMDISPRIFTMPTTTVVVAKANVTGIQIRVPQERMVTGRVLIDSGHAMPPTRLRVWINAASGQPPPPTGVIYTQISDPTIDTALDIRPDGSFTIVLPEGDHRLELGGLPTNFYEVKSLTYGSSDLLKEPMKVAGSDSREIVISLGIRQTEPWPKVRGRVLGMSNLRVPIRAVLRGTRLEFQTTVDSDGSFEFLKIPPDTYIANTNSTVSAMTRPTVIAIGDETLVELRIPDIKQMRVRGVVDGNGRVPSFSLTVRLNGTEGYRISANPQANMTFVYISPMAFVCTLDTCTNARSGTSLNEPTASMISDGGPSFRLTLPVGEHRLEVDKPPPGYELKSITYGTADLLKEPLRILEEGGEILLTFKPK